jgi:hypothetical protein
MSDRFQHGENHDYVGMGRIAEFSNALSERAERLKQFSENLPVASFS